MSLERRDEMGPIPADIAELLTPHVARGPRQAVLANVQIASGALIIVRAAAGVQRETGMSVVIQAIRDHAVPFLICDPTTNLEDVARWARAIPETSGSTRILVTGPRGTRWSDGEALARRIVGAIAMDAQGT